jgi:hypothetical protein
VFVADRLVHATVLTSETLIKGYRNITALNLVSDQRLCAITTTQAAL